MRKNIHASVRAETVPLTVNKKTNSTPDLGQHQGLEGESQGFRWGLPPLLQGGGSGPPPKGLGDGVPDTPPKSTFSFRRFIPKIFDSFDNSHPPKCRKWQLSQFFWIKLYHPWHAEISGGQPSVGSDLHKRVGGSWGWELNVTLPFSRDAAPPPPRIPR